MPEKKSPVIKFSSGGNEEVQIGRRRESLNIKTLKSGKKVLKSAVALAGMGYIRN